VIPFLCVACIFQVIQRLLHIPESASLFIMVAFSDVMALNFFFLVKVGIGSSKVCLFVSYFAQYRILEVGAILEPVSAIL